MKPLTPLWKNRFPRLLIVILIAASLLYACSKTPKSAPETPIPGCEDTANLSPEELANCGTHTYHIVAHAFNDHWAFPAADGTLQMDLDTEKDITVGFSKFEFLKDGVEAGGRWDSNKYGLQNWQEHYHIEYVFTPTGFTWVLESDTWIEGCSSDPLKKCQYGEATIVK